MCIMQWLSVALAFNSSHSVKNDSLDQQASMHLYIYIYMWVYIDLWLNANTASSTYLIHLYNLYMYICTRVYNTYISAVCCSVHLHTSCRNMHANLSVEPVHVYIAIGCVCIVYSIYGITIVLIHITFYYAQYVHTCTACNLQLFILA